MFPEIAEMAESANAKSIGWQKTAEFRSNYFSLGSRDVVYQLGKGLTNVHEN
jgi:hypothetical protein